MRRSLAEFGLWPIANEQKNVLALTSADLTCKSLRDFQAVCSSLSLRLISVVTKKDNCEAITLFKKLVEPCAEIRSLCEPKHSFGRIERQHRDVLAGVFTMKV